MRSIEPRLRNKRVWHLRLCYGYDEPWSGIHLTKAEYIHTPQFALSFPLLRLARKE